MAVFQLYLPLAALYAFLPVVGFNAAYPLMVTEGVACVPGCLLLFRIAFDIPDDIDSGWYFIPCGYVSPYRGLVRYLLAVVATPLFYTIPLHSTIIIIVIYPAVPADPVYR